MAILNKFSKGVAALLGFIIPVVLIIFFDEFFQSTLLAGIVMFAIASVSLYFILRRGLLGGVRTLPDLFFANFGIMSALVAFGAVIMTIDESSLNLDGTITVFTVIISIGIGLIFRHISIEQMKNVEHATEAKKYLKKKSVSITKRNDIFLVYEKWRDGTLDETSTDINKGKF